VTPSISGRKWYYDFNIRNHSQFVEKLRYIHGKPVRVGGVTAPRTGRGAVFSATRRALKDASRSSRNGRHENANEQREDFAQLSNCPTQAKTALE
jgi:hypothetical protein